jgi:uncharacterized RDD family membrane protein YckC
MIWWVLGLAILSILSYLSDLGILNFLDFKVPVLHASLLSLLILLATLGLLYRILWMRKKGQREQMQKKIQDLEGKLASLVAEKK